MPQEAQSGGKAAHSIQLVHKYFAPSHGYLVYPWSPESKVIFLGVGLYQDRLADHRGHKQRINICPVPFGS